MVCRMMASSDVMAITKWSIQPPRPRRAPPSVSGPKTISNVLAEERPFLSARIGIARLARARAASGHAAAAAPPNSVMKSLALPLPRRRCWRRGRGGGTGIGELERLQRVNEAGAEIVVALAGREPLGARGQDAANVGVSFGLRSSSSATMPLTSAAATEVPVVI